MQHFGINLGGIWRFKLGFLLSGFLCFFLLKNYALIFKSPMATDVVLLYVLQCIWLTDVVTGRYLTTPATHRTYSKPRTGPI